MNRKNGLLATGIAFALGGVLLLLKSLEANLGHINKDGPTWHGPVGWGLLALGVVLLAVATLLSE